MEAKNMKINNECCCGCKTEKPDQIKDNCPVCNNEGISVSKVTVEHLVVDDYRNAVNGDQYAISSSKCNTKRTKAPTPGG